MDGSRGIPVITHCIEAVEDHGVPAVKLWRVDLDAYAGDTSLDGLSRAERARARRMRERVATRYLAARHALRAVLAEMLGCPAASLIIETDTLGKPCLISDGPVYFNLSHSGHLCMIGVGLRQPIGVDIEAQRTVSDSDRLAHVHFTQNERREWSLGPGDAAFLRCWTRKEACLKALGVGLSVAPARVDAGCTADARTVSVPLGTHTAAVEVHSLDGAAACACAVAIATPEDAILARRSFAS